MVRKWGRNSTVSDDKMAHFGHVLAFFCFYQGHGKSILLAFQVTLSQNEEKVSRRSFMLQPG